MLWALPEYCGAHLKFIYGGYKVKRINITTHCKRFGSQDALYILLTLDLYFTVPEDDSEKVETCRPKIAFYVIKLPCF